MFKRVNRLAIELPRPKAPDPNGASVVIRPRHIARGFGGNRETAATRRWALSFVRIL
ncbi:hypothetical protein RW092_03285 [Paenibacillus sp. 3LSP]|uniref:hypothetical protein n=1 Tax=Paenibacillus sp. 3LSP TaxID=2800795 RepID=UPI0028FD16BF|nr:hypothetical protein [Paenibacillus sp. 3LSP]MDU0329224.1 hypothetical protein [Paenibacillus sp. 3LSP]